MMIKLISSEFRRWPESCPPPMAYARAFVALLWSTVGPTATWNQSKNESRCEEDRMKSPKDILKAIYIYIV